MFLVDVVWSCGNDLEAMKNEQSRKFRGRQYRRGKKAGIVNPRRVKVIIEGSYFSILNYKK